MGARVCMCVSVCGGGRGAGWRDGEKGSVGVGVGGVKLERRTGPQIISNSLLKAKVLVPAWLTENTEDECTVKSRNSKGGIHGSRHSTQAFILTYSRHTTGKGKERCR